MSKSNPGVREAYYGVEQSGHLTGEHVMDSQKRLYRSTEDRMFAGVCGGIAEYLEVDPTLVRLVFVALTLLGAPGVFLYIILMLIVPEQPQKSKKKREVLNESAPSAPLPLPEQDGQIPPGEI